MYGNPFPSSPIKFSAGISTLSNAISAVSDALQPNLSSLVAGQYILTVSSENEVRTEKITVVR
jgi:hypothetical protein